MAVDNPDDVKDGSIDSDIGHHDNLKGGIVIGAIAGEEARQAIEQEHNLSFTEALKLYPTAVGWSVFFSLGIIMTVGPFPNPLASLPQC